MLSMEFLQSLVMTPYGAFTALLFVMVMGEVIVKATKGVLPSAFGVTILLLAGFWSGILPPNIVEISGITAAFFGLISALKFHRQHLLSFGFLSKPHTQQGKVDEYEEGNTSFGV